MTDVDFPLTILAGQRAWDRIRQEGWNPAIFTAMMGASGGAKMLALTHLDRFLFGEYLQQTSHPMELYGSSIGSWRHAALAAPDPCDAVTRLQERYLNQRWDENDTRSPGQIVDELCDWVLEGVCGPELISHLCSHPRFSTHIVTSRGIGLNNQARGIRLAAGMALAAVGNVLDRRLLASGFQRVVFSSGPSTAFQFDDFSTEHVALTPDNLITALLASGSIPFLMSGQRNPIGAPAGQYWDGGIIDYHFDFANHKGEGLVLYPHFSGEVVKGWFDKSLPWRRNKASALDRTVILAPSNSYLTTLPNGKIPDRKDFNRYSQQERLTNWEIAMDKSKVLATAFAEVVADSDPLRHVTRLNETAGSTGR